MSHNNYSCEETYMLSFWPEAEKLKIQETEAATSKIAKNYPLLLHWKGKLSDS